MGPSSSPATSLLPLWKCPPSPTLGITSPSLNPISQAASRVPNCPTARRRACSGLGRVLMPCPVWEMGLRDCCELPDPAGLRHHSPACLQGPQMLSSAVRLASEHTEFQKGLKGNQRRQKFVLISFYCAPPLASSAFMFQPSWDWATGKEPGFIRLTPPPEVVG